MKKIFGVLLSAAITVAVMTFFIGDEFELKDKQWLCHPVEKRLDCVVSFALVNKEDYDLKVKLVVRGIQQDNKQVVLSAEWLEDLAPMQEKRLEKAFITKFPLQKVIVSAFALKKDLVE